MPLKKVKSFSNYHAKVVGQKHFNTLNEIDVSEVKKELYDKGEETYNPELDHYCVPVETQPCSAKNVVVQFSKFFKEPPSIDEYLMEDGRVHPELENKLWTKVAEPIQKKVSRRLSKLSEAKEDNLDFVFVKNWTNNSEEKTCETHELLACVNRKNLIKLKEKYIRF